MLTHSFDIIKFRRFHVHPFTIIVIILSDVSLVYNIWETITVKGHLHQFKQLHSAFCLLFCLLKIFKLFPDIAKSAGAEE